MLLNPKRHASAHPDPRTRELLAKTISFFEGRGKQRLKDDDHARVWYTEFLDFVKREQLFATFMTPAPYGGADSRWDTARICELNELLGFYGLTYWYTWQVSMLGLCPIWMSANEAVKQRTAQLLKEGGIFAFGLSEKEHGADLYASEMTLTLGSDGRHVARGSKYYIGNGNKAALVSTFGKIAGSKSTERGGDFVFFVVDSQHPKYECVQNVVASQSYVSEYRLHDYPITDGDILTRGRDAWDAALNTVNVCKFNLGWAAIGICTHAFYEALNHAAHRRLFDRHVTDFVHVRRLFVDAYARLVAMKVFARRATDYMRVASPEDRRYLLYNPMVKMKVTTQGEEVVNHLWDVIAAKGFEKSMYFEMATRDIRALPKLEGTVHVNMALVVKFMRNYFFKPGRFPDAPRRQELVDDTFLFAQGPTKGLGKIQFHDYRPVYDAVDLPNVNVFKKQIRDLKVMLAIAAPSAEQAKDFDFLLILGELFTLVVYGQLLLEGAKIDGVSEDLLEQIFDFMVRDFSKFALQLYSKTNATWRQRLLCRRMMRAPVTDDARYARVLARDVYAHVDAYTMNA
jgi:acyl-CoA dehydrogenase